MSPDGGGEPGGALGQAITDAFGSLDELKAAVNDACVKRFGLGWTWLVHDGTGSSHLDAEPGLSDQGQQDAAARHRRLGARLLPQVPEPAPEYLETWWNVVNWPAVAARFDAAGRS